MSGLLSVASSPATIGGRAIPEIADRARMRTERHARLQAQLAERDLDGVLVMGTANVSYATGAAAPATDTARSVLARQVALIVRGDEQPFLWTPYPDGVPDELADPEHVGTAAYPDLDDGADLLAHAIAAHLPAGSRLALDELPHALRRALDRHSVAVTSAQPVMSAARLEKTIDEVACIRAAQQLTERAMREILPMLRPGVRAVELSAHLLRTIFEMGVENVGVDPIWQSIAPTRAQMPVTVHGDIGFPVATRGDTVFGEGDVIWNDTGLHVGGYASDFGRTWIVAQTPTPSARQQAQCDRWRAIVDACLRGTRPGIATSELVHLATGMNDGVTPWLSHFYLAHGIGVSSAEMPMVGTDLGEEFDDRQVLTPGQILVFEPVVWDDGAGGYRAEEVVVVTDDGATSLCDFTFAPFEAVS